MARKFTKKVRDKSFRKTKPVILIIAEGTNETETQYFYSFQHQNAGYIIKVLCTGHKTDPEGMLNKIETYWNENGFDKERGDMAFVLVDLDYNEEKAKLIRRLEKKSAIAQFIVSNPCFEVWFLLHFGYSTKAFTSGNAVIDELKKHIPGYEKNMDVSGIILQGLADAIRNVQRLRQYHQDNGHLWPSKDCNPYSDADIVIQAIYSCKAMMEEKDE